MNANLTWIIVITCGKEIGSPIMATGWDVISKLGQVKNSLPAGWNVEAYPVIR